MGSSPVLLFFPGGAALCRAARSENPATVAGRCAGPVGSRRVRRRFTAGDEMAYCHCDSSRSIRDTAEVTTTPSSARTSSKPIIPFMLKVDCM